MFLGIFFYGVFVCYREIKLKNILCDWKFNELEIFDNKGIYYYSVLLYSVIVIFIYNYGGDMRKK